jgi:tRNA-Thr(GGU) m(6)t(6)A37 methyltransferase TsaA
METERYDIRPIGWVRSSLTERSKAPRQGREGAPAARLEIAEDVVDGLDGIAAGQKIVIVTWLHQGRRDVLRVRPRSDPMNRLTGVFNTRSPDRPNPIGLHRVTVLSVDGPHSLLVEPLEAIDGTPIVDIKPVLDFFMET